MFKKIICATDLSKTSRLVVKKAVQLAHQYDSKIIMLNIHEEFINKEEMGMLRVSIDNIKSEFEKTAIQAKNEMKEEIKSLHAENIEVEYILKDGKISKVICDEANQNNADLIIIGVSKKKMIAHLIFKNITSYVIAHTNIPVLVVPISNK